MIDVAISALAPFDAAGAVAGGTTITRDVTDQTRAMYALAQSDQRYGEILDAT